MHKRSDAVAVILVGGGGTRLWPLSRERTPKQFLPLVNGKSLFRLTLDRLYPLFPVENIYVVTTEKYYEQILLEAETLEDDNVIAEPIGRDTAAAIAAITGIIQSRNETATMAVFPADHLIKDVKMFCNDIDRASRFAREKEKIVTIGIPPSYPATSFGYIETEAGNDDFQKVKRFTEKPDIETARKMVAGGKHFWNSGMFVWRADVILGEFQKHSRQHYDAALKVRGAAGQSNFEKALADVYAGLQPISIDYTVMEKTDLAFMLPAKFDWDDIGTLASLHNVLGKDGNGNSVEGKVATLDTSDCIIYSGEDHITAAIGLKDFIIIHTSDATLICPKEKVQDVKRLYNQIRHGDTEHFTK